MPFSGLALVLAVLRGKLAPCGFAPRSQECIVHASTSSLQLPHLAAWGHGRALGAAQQRRLVTSRSCYELHWAVAAWQLPELCILLQTHARMAGGTAPVAFGSLVELWFDKTRKHIFGFCFSFQTSLLGTRSRDQPFPAPPNTEHLAWLCQEERETSG